MLAIEKWLDANLQKLKAIDSMERTPQQQELIDLAEQPDQTTSDEAKLKELITQEKDAQKKAAAQRKAVKVERWLDDNLPILKAYKKPTEAQVDLIALAEKADRTDTENKDLAVLVNVEKAYQSYQSKVGAIAERKKAASAEARKLENGQKIIDGGWLRQQVMTDPKIRDWYLRNAPKGITRASDIERMKPYWEKLADMDKNKTQKESSNEN